MVSCPKFTCGCFLSGQSRPFPSMRSFMRSSSPSTLPCGSLRSGLTAPGDHQDFSSYEGKGRTGLYPCPVFQYETMLKVGNRRDLLFVLIFLVCLVLTLKSSSDKLPNWLQGTRAAPWLLQYGTGNQNIHDIAVGIIVSLFIYFLVVRLQEIDKRKRVRRNLNLQYDSFKRQCVEIFFSALGQSYDPELIDSLKQPDKFKQFFKEPFSAEQSRWDAVANGLDTDKIGSLIVEFEIFIAEVRFTLIAIDVENEKAFVFLKRLANILYRARNCSPEYEGVKSLLGLMWSLFAGWSFIDGYTKEDVTADMIETL